MDSKTAIMVAGLLITMIVGFWRTAVQLGRMELKIDLMWESYVAGRRQGMRRPAAADDKPGRDR